MSQVSQKLNATGKRGGVLPGCGMWSLWTMWVVQSKEAGTNSTSLIPSIYFYLSE